MLTDALSEGRWLYLGDGSVEECRLVLGIVFHSLVVVVQCLHTESPLREDQATAVKQDRQLALNRQHVPTSHCPLTSTV